MKKQSKVGLSFPRKEVEKASADGTKEHGKPKQAEGVRKPIKGKGKGKKGGKRSQPQVANKNKKDVVGVVQAMKTAPAATETNKNTTTPAPQVTLSVKKEQRSASRTGGSIAENKTPTTITEGEKSKTAWSNLRRKNRIKAEKRARKERAGQVQKSNDKEVAVLGHAGDKDAEKTNKKKKMKKAAPESGASEAQAAAAGQKNPPIVDAFQLGSNFQNLLRNNPQTAQKQNRSTKKSFKNPSSNTSSNTSSRPTSTSKPASSSTTTQFLALDCEMVGDHDGNSILARISLVDQDLNCLLDCLVRPLSNDLSDVKDFRTHVTGLTRASFDRKKSCSFKAAQMRLLEEIQKRTTRSTGSKGQGQHASAGSYSGTTSGAVMLIGHAITNDLHVLGLPFTMSPTGATEAKNSSTSSGPHLQRRLEKHPHYVVGPIDQKNMNKLRNLQASGTTSTTFPVIDTQILYPGRARLQDLALEHLAEKIQEGAHDSVVDARTTMRLFKRLVA
ncbi:unnamed protein product [Amoebophrya sp. A25]|nr:unnamed protein product [Amoebophrya sp. A25]|eukprot:GSA25T00006999001.1